MTKDDSDFEAWFDYMAMAVDDLCGLSFTDSASVKDMYNRGVDAFEAAEQVADEYSE